MSKKEKKAEKVVDPSKQTYQNPYRNGSKYATAFDILMGCRKKGKPVSFVKSWFAEKCAEFGLSMDGVVVMLSPTEHSERGDCRGNRASKGEYYFIKRLKKVPGEEKKLQFCWRKEVLPSLRKEIKAQKAQETVEAEQTEQTEQAEQAEQTQDEAVEA